MAFDPADYCSNPKCGGAADACGCPADLNTQDRMRCLHCGGSWWREHGVSSTRCPHPGCQQEASVVERPAKYAPSFDEQGEPIETVDDEDEACGEGHCRCYCIGGPGHACGCDCPHQDDCDCPDCMDHEAYEDDTA